MPPAADIASVIFCITEFFDRHACGPPARDDAPEPVRDWDLLGQPEPDVEFDQRVSW
jgi:hypothetical protein